VPLGRVPYYAFLGRKPARKGLTDNPPRVNGIEMIG
jgi:hypothetical protein